MATAGNATQLVLAVGALPNPKRLGLGFEALGTFDPMKDQHPVKFARDELHLDDTLMQPLRTWIVQRFPGALVPEAGKMFDASPNHDLRCEVSSSERALAVFGVPAVPGSGQA